MNLHFNRRPRTLQSSTSRNAAGTPCPCLKKFDAARKESLLGHESNVTHWLQQSMLFNTVFVCRDPNGAVCGAEIVGSRQRRDGSRFCGLAPGTRKSKGRFRLSAGLRQALSNACRASRSGAKMRLSETRAPANDGGCCHDACPLDAGPVQESISEGRTVGAGRLGCKLPAVTEFTWPGWRY